MKLLPIGTIIKVNGHKTCIMGYASVEKETGIVIGYWVISYPLGFIDIDKLFFIPNNMEFEIISTGYKTSNSDRLLETLGKSLQMLENVPDEDLIKFNEVYRKNMLSTKGASKE